MKLLLTSASIANSSTRKALLELTEKPFNQLNLAFVPTASNLEEGDKKDWFIKDLELFKNLGFASIDIVDISALPKKVWLERLKPANVLVFEGGNVYHLMYWINESGLNKVLPELLKTKIYIGISAGSIVATPSLINAANEKPLVQEIGEAIYDQGLGLVDFMVEPHMNNKCFPELTFENLEKRSKSYDYPIYGLDDNSAIKIIDKKIEVISEGKWKKFN